jgi:peptidoglycan/xylan/chitin deacetylase (PgdA/CDA1 family)
VIRELLRVSGAPGVRRLLLHGAVIRRRSMVLLYHDIDEECPDEHRTVRPVSPQLLRAHLEAISSIGDIVPLASLLKPAEGGRRPRIALTFDDDSATFARNSIPLLRELGVPATFFLSGRALHGLSPSWWDLLDWWINHAGLEATRRLLGAPSTDPRELAAWCEGREVVNRLFDEAPAGAAAARLLGRDGIREIAAAGFTIGFHTLHHPVLTDLDPSQIEPALTEGRAALEAWIGAPLTMLSYPHGRTNDRVASAAARAGYQAAFGSRGRPIAAASNRFRLDRWEPGPISPDALLAGIGWRLHRPIT